jgi:23S rRNA pseudouridine1911/1915/1917 synthase
MAAMGHPVVGDPLYGAVRSPFNRYFLHAHRLVFTSPASGERVALISPLAPELEEWLSSLRGPAPK